MKAVLSDPLYFFSSKIWLMRSFVLSIFLYACETWTISADLQRRIQTMEMRCFRKMLYVRLIKIMCCQRRGPRHLGRTSSNGTIQRPPDSAQEAQTEVGRPRLTIIWPRNKTFLQGTVRVSSVVARASLSKLPG